MLERTPIKDGCIIWVNENHVKLYANKIGETWYAVREMSASSKQEALDMGEVVWKQFRQLMTQQRQPSGLTVVTFIGKAG